MCAAQFISDFSIIYVFIVFNVHLLIFILILKRSFVLFKSVCCECVYFICINININSCIALE